MSLKKMGLLALFVAGSLLISTVSFQLTLGVLLVAVSYSELRKEGIDLNQLDDMLINKIKELSQVINNDK